MPEVNKLTLLSGMAMLVQSCATEDELFDAVAYWYLPLLFQGRSGAVYLAEDGDQSLKQRLAWGEEALLDEVSASCPVLQAGIPVSGRSAPSRHCVASGREMYCVPFRESKEVFGMLCLEAENTPILHDDRGTAFITAEYLMMAIANLRLRKRLYHMAIRDDLTSLYNRRHMDEILLQEIRRATRLKTSLGVLMVDIDYFKRINDSYGHAAGDLVLKSLADMLVEEVRKEDVVCRLGGEEFLVLLTNGTLEDYMHRAEYIRGKIADMDLSWDGRQIRPVTVSVGVAAFPQHAHALDALLDQADLALYRAKNSGRNRVESADGFKAEM